MRFFNVGYMYSAGLGVTKNYFEAFKWYRKGAEVGDANSMNNLGQLYREGLGVEENQTEALKWWRKGAEAGNSSAMDNLGLAYYLGINVPMDHEEAIKWLSKAAEAGNNNAMGNLCGILAFGDANIINKHDAIKWCEKGAQAGNRTAMNNLGWIFKLGLNGAKNYTEALKWFNKSAEAGSALGKLSLGQAYIEGKGVPQSSTEAARWFARGLQSTSEVNLETREPASRKARRLLDEMIAKGQITDAAVRQEVAAVFKPAPKAEWTSLPSSTNTENTEIVLRLSDAGGGIGDIQLFIDGAIVDRNASRDFGVEATKDLTRRSFTVKLPEGRHDIKIRAYAAENIGNFTELSGSITSTWKKISKPKLHLIAVGVNEFTEKDLNLKYAQADAKAVYDSLNKQIGGLYDKGETRLLPRTGIGGKTSHHQRHPGRPAKLPIRRRLCLLRRQSRQEL